MIMISQIPLSHPQLSLVFLDNMFSTISQTQAAQVNLFDYLTNKLRTKSYLKLLTELYVGFTLIIYLPKFSFIYSGILINL